MTSTGSIDSVKYVLNRIAVVNDEDLIRDKIAFSMNPAQAAKRRTIKFMIKNLINSKQKITLLAVFGLCWLSYMVA